MKKAIVDELRVLAHISFALTAAARGTYEAGTDNVLNPSALRKYNEIQHRITAAIRDRLDGETDFMPIQDVLDMLDVLGRENEGLKDIAFFLEQVIRHFGDDWLKLTANPSGMGRGETQ